MLLPRLALVALALLLAACDGGAPAGGSPAGPPGGGAPPPTVTVLRVHTGAVPLSVELPGRTTPYLIAEVRPQVTGIIKDRPFEEGSDVTAGQLLYQIDPAPYQAALDTALAQLARAEANLKLAELKARRYSGLQKSDAVSRQSNDEAIAEAEQARADVAAANAAVQKARIELDYTRVKAPIAGRIGRSAVTPGALVTANQAASLATVQQLDPIFVDMTQSSTEVLRIRKQLESGTLRRTTDGELPVRLLLEDGSEYAEEGRLAFLETSVDEGTGSVTLRARFPNPKDELLPGTYVRARLPLGALNDAILVPHAALTRDPRGQALVMVVNAEDKVEARPVTTVQSQGDHWVISAGLADGERIITEGLQRARPGTLVHVDEPTPGAAAGSGGQQTSAAR